MLWTGLSQNLKDISGHKYDSIPDFDSLRVALRQIEKDHSTQKESDAAQQKKQQGTSKSAVTTEDFRYQELKGMISQLTQQVSDLKQSSYQQNTQYQQSYNRGSYRDRGYQRGNYQPFRVNRQQQQQSKQQPPANQTDSSPTQQQSAPPPQPFNH